MENKFEKTASFTFSLSYDDICERLQRHLSIFFGIEMTLEELVDKIDGKPATNFVENYVSAHLGADPENAEETMSEIETVHAQLALDSGIITQEQFDTFDPSEQFEEEED